MEGGVERWAFSGRALAGISVRTGTTVTQILAPWITITGLDGSGKTTLVRALSLDAHGNVFASDDNNDHVVELPAGSTQATVLPFHGLSYPGGLTVDTSGDLFVVDNGDNRVLELPSGWRSDAELPFDGLNEPYAVAVGPAGDLYVADSGNNRVLKLPAAAG